MPQIILYYVHARILAYAHTCIYTRIHSSTNVCTLVGNHIDLLEKFLEICDTQTAPFVFWAGCIPALVVTSFEDIQVGVRSELWLYALCGHFLGTPFRHWSKREYIPPYMISRSKHISRGSFFFFFCYSQEITSKCTHRETFGFVEETLLNGIVTQKCKFLLSTWFLSRRKKVSAKKIF